MPDITSKIKLLFTADTSDAKRKIKDLSGEQKKAAKQTLQQVEQENAALDKKIAKWTKVAGAVAAAAASFHVLHKAAVQYATMSRLQLAAAGKDIDRLKDATKGLMTEQELLTLAARTNSGAFKLNQKQLENTAKVMIILRNRGFDMAEVQRDVMQSAVEANTEQLKKYGLTMEGLSSNTMAAHIAIQKEFGKLVRDNTGDLALAGDETRRAEVAWTDAIDHLVEALGRFANQLAPVVEMIAQIADFTIDSGVGGFFTKNTVFSGAGGLAGALYRADPKNMHGGRFLSGYAGAQQRKENKAFIDRRNAEAWRPVDETLSRGFVKYGKLAAGSFIDDLFSWEKRRKGGGRYQLGFAQAEGTRATPWSMTGNAPLGSFAGAQLPGLGGIGLNQQLRTREGRFDMGAFADKIGGGNEAQIAANAALANSFTQLAQIGSNAFATLASASGEAFASMIDGTKLAAGGFKAMMGDILHTMASQMFGVAITEGVLALVALAKAWMGNPLALGEAKAHGVAAAAATAGGAAIAGMSRAFGGGGQGAGAMPGAAAGAVGGGAGTTGSSVTIYVGSDFEENPRGRAQRLRRAFDRAHDMEPGGSIILNE